MPVRRRLSIASDVEEPPRKCLKLEEIDVHVHLHYDYNTPIETLGLETFATQPPVTEQSVDESQTSLQLQYPSSSDSSLSNHSTTSASSASIRDTDEHTQPRRPRDFADAIFPEGSFARVGSARSTLIELLLKRLRKEGRLAHDWDALASFDSASLINHNSLLRELNRFTRSAWIQNRRFPDGDGSARSTLDTRYWLPNRHLAGLASTQVDAVFTSHLPKLSNELRETHEYYCFLTVGNSLKHAKYKAWQCYDTIRETTCNRRFVLALAFFETSFVICRFDPQGLVDSPTYDLRTVQGTRALIHFVLGLACLPESFLGKDDTIFYDHDIGNWFVQVGPGPDSEKYEILETLFRSGCGDPRATQVFRCADPSGGIVVVKDSWVHRPDLTKESDVMQRARAAGITEGVLQLRAYWEVPPHGVSSGCDSEDNTRDFRTDVWYLCEYIDREMLECERVHRRISFTPHAEPIETARNLSELLLAVMDAVITHEQLLDRIGVLHRDISPGNIMLAPALKPNERRKGVLIDLDQAGNQDTPAGEYGRWGTGTPGFMALELIQARPGALYDPRWDLTAMFLVMLSWLNTLQRPGKSRRPTGVWADWVLFRPDGTVLPEEDVAREQLAILHSEDRFLDFLNERGMSTDYTYPLWDVMLRLRRAVVDNAHTLDHQVFLGIIREEVVKLPCFEGYRDSEYPAPTLQRLIPGYIPGGAR